MKFLSAIFVSLFIGLSPANADVVIGDFKNLNGVPTADSGGTVTFSLNNNGTINATLVSTLAGEIFGFGYSSFGTILGSSYNPGQPTGLFGYVSTTYYGPFDSGFQCNPSCGTTINWTLDKKFDGFDFVPVTFSSVLDALDGPYFAGINFFLLGANNQEWSATAEVLVAGAVPETSTWAMMIVGFGGIGLLVYRRRQRPMPLIQPA